MLLQQRRIALGRVGPLGQHHSAYGRCMPAFGTVRAARPTPVTVRVHACANYGDDDKHPAANKTPKGVPSSEPATTSRRTKSTKRQASAKQSSMVAPETQPADALPAQGVPTLPTPSPDAPTKAASRKGKASAKAATPKASSASAQRQGVSPKEARAKKDQGGSRKADSTIASHGDVVNNIVPFRLAQATTQVAVVEEQVLDAVQQPQQRKKRGKHPHERVAVALSTEWLEVRNALLQLVMFLCSTSQLTAIPCQILTDGTHEELTPEQEARGWTIVYVYYARNDEAGRLGQFKVGYTWGPAGMRLAQHDLCKQDCVLVVAWKVRPFGDVLLDFSNKNAKKPHAGWWLESLMHAALGLHKVSRMYGLLAADAPPCPVCGRRHREWLYVRHPKTGINLLSHWQLFLPNNAGLTARLDYMWKELPNLRKRSKVAVSA